MANLYDDYVWRLTSASPAYDLVFPKDLEWTDEFTWSPIQQTVSTSLSGALIIQESTQLKGRPITLQGQDNMAWIQRSIGDSLLALKMIPGLIMNLSFCLYNGVGFGAALHNYNVMFRHYEPPVVDLITLKRFDQFEPDNWMKVTALRFMEVSSGATTPCTANVTLTLTDITGTFNIGDAVTDDEETVVATVLGYSSPTIQLYVADGSFESGDTITGPSGSATVS